MDVLVTGATGYIGSTVAQALQANGHIVTGVARAEDKVRQLESNGCQVCRADLKDSESLEAAARQAEGVIHTAAAWGISAAWLGPERAFCDGRVFRRLIRNVAFLLRA